MRAKGRVALTETWYRPLWGWIVDHLIDPELVQKFEWDAQKVFRLKDGAYTQIFTEPWTGKRFWDAQVNYLVFLFKIYLTHVEDIPTKRWETGLYRTVCRQVQALIFRDRKRVPRHGENLEPPRKDQERCGGWGCPCCRMAPSGMFKMTFDRTRN